jgi:phosphate transport system substrate-binding protein
MKTWLSALVTMCLVATGSPARAEKIVIRGSNTFGEFIGPQLVAAFCRDNPGMEFDLESKGSATGIAALIEGTCDIGASSRMLTQEEWRLARSRGIRLSPHPVGYYGVAVIVHETNPVRSLTDHQVRDLFTGTEKHWSRLSGQDARVQPYIRDPISGTHLGFRELAMQNQPYSPQARLLTNDWAIAEAVRADPAGIGYVGIHLSKHPGVRAVSVNGVPPSALAINEEMYPYARLMILYVNSDKVSLPARQFIRFVQSRRGQAVLEQHGYVPVNARRLTSSTGSFN